MVMTEVFKTIFRLSMEGAIIAVFAGILLALMRFMSVSKKTGFILWGVIAVRLICPIYIPVDYFSENLLIHMSEENDIDTELFTARKQITYDNYTLEELVEYVEFGDAEFSAGYHEMSGSSEKESRIQKWFFETKVLDAVTVLWMSGVAFFCLYGVYSFIRFKKKLQFAMKASDGTYYEVDTIASPCVFGLIYPKIYLLLDMDEKSKKYALCHERHHIQNHDQIWKLLSYMIICVHWFNPILWVMYLEFQKYLEENCDEQVVNELGFEQKEDYCETILKMAVQKRRSVFSAMSLSEEHEQNEIKSRIKQILKYKRSKKSVQIVVALVFVVFGIFIFIGEKTIANEVDVSSEQEKNLTEFAELLFEHKNQYIGDASANGALLNVLSDVLPDTSYTMRLFTDDVPYGLRVVFEKGPQDLENTDEAYLRLYKPAAVLLALIDNADQIMWEYPYDENYVEDYKEIEKHWALATYRNTPETRSVVQYHRREDVETELAIDNIKEYGESAEKIKELLEILQWPEADFERYFEFDILKSNPKIDYMTIDKVAYLENKERIEGRNAPESFEMNAPDTHFFELYIKDAGFCEEYPIELRIYGFHSIWFMQECELVIEWYNTDGYYFKGVELSVNLDDSLTYRGNLNIPSICFYNADDNVITSVPWDYSLKFEFDYNSNQFRRINETYVRVIK